jgi:hypothetical protein
MDTIAEHTHIVGIDVSIRQLDLVDAATSRAIRTATFGENVRSREGRLSRCLKPPAKAGCWSSLGLKRETPKPEVQSTVLQPLGTIGRI